MEDKAEMIDPKKEFLKEFGRLSYSHSAWEIWNDFVVMAACALSNPVDKMHYEEREARYGFPGNFVPEHRTVPRPRIAVLLAPRLYHPHRERSNEDHRSGNSLAGAFVIASHVALLRGLADNHRLSRLETFAYKPIKGEDYERKIDEGDV